MKFTLSWLKDHLDTMATLNEIVTKLTAVGLELEELEDRGAAFASFKVAEVIEAVPHPNADRLRVCQVKTENGMIQVVCGAPNARSGMKAVYAPEGSLIPASGLVLKKTKIRDVESNGMLVSEREMGLGEDHNGIIDLPLETPIGTPMADIFGLNDPVIEINLTPNRPDCAGVRGIARDLAAAGLGSLKPLPVPKVPAGFESKIKVSLNIDEENKSACPLFLGREIRGVKNGPSPEWLQTRLKAIGLRPISALVDITNYFCVGLCRPLHVFDADKLTGNIHVRFAKDGETLDALNDKSYTLSNSMIAVCDDSGVLGLGGIVGGVATGCSETTTNVYLEAAYFDPLRIARAGRALQLSSDARYRFERGVDPAFTIDAVELATKMILDLCGGEAGSVVQAGEVPPCRAEIRYAPDHFKKLIGFDLPEKTQTSLLDSLGFVVEDQGAHWKVTAPSWRPDVFGPADIVEELARINGFDAIPPISVTKETAVTQAAETPRGARIRKIRGSLAAAGLQECVTWSFMEEKLALEFGANDKGKASSLHLSNPISNDLDQMRPSILPNLIAAAGRNADRGYPGAALFEVGPIFLGSDANEQPYVASGIRTGSSGPRHWSGAETARPVDTFDAKADMLRVLESCGAPMASAQITREAPRWFHPGRSGALRLGSNILAYFGEIHPALLDKMGIKGPVVGFEVFLESLPTQRKKSSTALPLVQLSAFQPVLRDFAFLCEAKTEAENLVRAIRLVDKDLISDVNVFDVYQGKGVPEGQKSVAVAVTISPKERSLTDSEIDALSKKIIEAVAQKTGGVLRG
ncbi:MAG: phenylalanine--tRNA ligase subunit beta [Alphaproteobacteria bacterium]|nr:phenylalanine--tRNA ligase subunit beta [Alphaproteobacteria bacterium]